MELLSNCPRRQGKIQNLIKGNYFDTKEFIAVLVFTAIYWGCAFVVITMIVSLITR